MFKQIIKELCDAGLTQSEISKKTGISQAAISSFLTGSRIEPSWSRGKRLIELHQEVTKKAI